MIFERIIKLFRHNPATDLNQFRALFERFRQILAGNNQVLQLISELDDKLSGEYVFDINFLKSITDRISREVYLIISNLNLITDNRFSDLFSRYDNIREELQNILEDRYHIMADKYIIEYDDINTDITEIVGEKSANLGIIKNRLKMLVPDGFVVATSAYQRIMTFNNLWPKIHELYEDYHRTNLKSFKQYDDAIDKLFERASIPPDIYEIISKRLNTWKKHKRSELRLVIRSSAFGEDNLQKSYAGQFQSFLNVHPDNIFQYYIKVIASRFKHIIEVYGGKLIVEETELPMAVAVQEMIDAKLAGVAYSVNPSAQCFDCMTIVANYGLGVSVVDGIVGADTIKVSRIDPTHIMEYDIGKKNLAVVPAKQEGIAELPVRKNLQGLPCLIDELVTTIAESVILLERYFRRAVDIEWCLDNNGKLYIIQCRPLSLPLTPPSQPFNLEDILADKTVIMRNRGEVAQRGIAAGKVWHILEEDDPDEFPAGAIAVTKYATPRLTSIIHRAAAIITDIGNTSGHMATVAREFGIPMIVNTSVATSLLKNNDEITVDAEENIIYKGIIKELLAYDVESEDLFRDMKEYRMLRRLLRKISPLTLIDPSGANFTVNDCHTYHDIIRFCHEKAVQKLINLNISSRSFRGIRSKNLKLPIPLGLSVIDLGGGVRPDAKDKEYASLEDIQSRPMQAILKGLTSPGIWSTQPIQLGFGDFVSSLTRYSMTDRVAEYQGTNLAVISDKYTNLSLRLGYHFNVVDTYVSDNINDNYIYFRFVGGVTEPKRRYLRAILLKEILEKINFKVTVNGDLVIARLKKWEADKILHVLGEIGRLIGFSRQLDTQMYNEDSVQKCLHDYFQHD